VAEERKERGGKKKKKRSGKRGISGLSAVEKMRKKEGGYFKRGGKEGIHLFDRGTRGSRARVTSKEEREESAGVLFVSPFHSSKRHRPKEVKEEGGGGKEKKEGCEIPLKNFLSG